MKHIVALFLYLMSLRSFSFQNLENTSYYRISSGDIISVNIYPATEFSRDVTVSPDGSIDLPLVGNLKVSGFSVSEVEKIITEKISKYVANPKVSVSIKMFSSYKVAIIGSVQRSGYYQYWENMNILELIAQAGGLSDYADTRNIKIYRKVRDEKGNIRDLVIDVSIDDFFKVKPERVPILESGDIVYVPKQKFTSKSKWVADNIMPWTIITSFFISVAIILSR